MCNLRLGSLGAGFYFCVYVFLFPRFLESQLLEDKQGFGLGSLMSRFYTVSSCLFHRLFVILKRRFISFHRVFLLVLFFVHFVGIWLNRAN